MLNSKSAYQSFEVQLDSRLLDLGWNIVCGDSSREGDTREDIARYGQVLSDYGRRAPNCIKLLFTIRA